MHVLPFPARYRRTLLAALVCSAGIWSASVPGHRVPLVLSPASVLASAPVPDDSPAQVAALLPHRNEGYPQLANYNGFELATDVPAMAYNGLIIAPQQADRGAPSPVQLLRRADPGARILVYQRTLQVDYPLIKSLYGINSIYPGWWLLRTGSVLTTSITAGQTRIPVANPSRFHRYDDVLVGAESMHVLAIQGSNLVVKRGFYSRAAAHAVGVRIAAHYSYRVDLRNSLITGKHENRRPWSFNLSSLCPRDPQGRTWNDFLAEFMATMMRQGHWDGVFFDNTDELLRDAWVDVNNDNLPDGGVLGARNVWHEGQLDLLHRFRALVPRALVMDNGTLDAGLASNGREMENFPLANGLYMAGMSDYGYWQRHDTAPSLVLLNPDSLHSTRFNLDAMRFGLASALLGDGFYTYDEGWHKHGAAWNFDEYDRGAGSALLNDTDSHTIYLRVAHTFRFHAGDLLVVGHEQMRVLDMGTWNLIVQRGVNGTVATTHPAGSVVATPAQIAAGSGYLGQPLGPAYDIAPPLTTHNMVENGGFKQLGAHWELSVHGTQTHAVESGVFETGYVHSRPAGQAERAHIDPAIIRSGLRDPRGFDVNLAWQPLRDPQAISLTQRDIVVTPRTSYTLTFWARGTAGMTLPILLSGERPGWHMRYASYAVTLHAGWYRYVLRYTAPSDVHRLSIAFQFGHTFGHTAVTGIILQRGQTLVFARAFQHGMVLVNQSDRAQYIRLPRTYWHISGDQAPQVNNGQPVHALWIAAHAGMILVDSPPQG